MSSSLADYKHALETWRTSRLGVTFMNIYVLKGSDSKKIDNPKRLEEQLEIVCGILRSRPFDEREEIYGELRRQRELSAKRDDFERAAVYRDMIKYWDRHVEMIPDGL